MSFFYDIKMHYGEFDWLVWRLANCSGDNTRIVSERPHLANVSSAQVRNTAKMRDYRSNYIFIACFSMGFVFATMAT